MKEKKLRYFLALAVCAVVLSWSAWQITAAGHDLQYLITAPRLAQASQQDQQDQQNGEDTPAQKPNQESLTLWESLKTAAQNWNGIIKTYTMSGILENASMTSDTGETKQARLNALNTDAYLLTPQYLLFGRLFYPEELKDGSDGIVLDEHLALALFKISQPIGRIVTIANIKFTVIGVVRHGKSVGYSEDYGAYVPIGSLWDKEIQLQALQVTARPIPGAGARSAFSKDMLNWAAGGTLIDLGKEGMGAMLPLRVLLFFVGMALFFRLLKVWNGRFMLFFADYRQRLIRQYAVRLMPRLILGLLALALGYGVLALGAAFLIQYIVAPVYTFPEWVPAILVEWKDIQTAFWQVWQSVATLTELRSPELIRIRYFGMLTAWFSAGAAVTLTVLWVRWWARREHKKDKVGTSASL